MEVLNAIGANEVLIAGGTSWMICQVLKTIIYLIINKKLRLERLVGDGGMPSCHSATVAGIATACAIVKGIDSAAFAIAFFLAIIVMHDAMGVRLETGRQAKVLNDMMQEFRERGMEFITMSPEQRLKEFVGHTGSQVFVGAAVGILVAVFEYLLIYKP